MLKIVADHKIPFLHGALEKFAHVVYMPGSQITRDHLLDADALIVRTRTRCNEALLKGTAVKFIASATIGYDHIDTAYCYASGITWTNAPGCNSGSVKQYIASALATILTLEQKNPEDITLGIIGVGNVGSKIEKLCKALGIKTLLNDPPRQQKENSGIFSDLRTVLTQSDIVTLHVPLFRSGENSTVHLADAGFLASMKEGSWLINSSRGEVVDTHALKHALRSKHLRSAILDVWENEPLIDTELLSQVHIATPHIAGYSADGKANGTAWSVQSLSRFFGLGIDSWYPDHLPESVEQSGIIIDCSDQVRDIFSRVSLGAYDISKDSERLKNNPQTFELQRENYPVRREPYALNVQLLHPNKPCTDMIRDLGYNINS